MNHYRDGEWYGQPSRKLPMNVAKAKSVFDVFLSHNSTDNAAVERLSVRLEDEAQLKPFLDKWHLVPGDPWQEDLEKALDQSATCAVFLGANGLGAWENEEMRSALNDRVHQRGFRVIPVLLLGADPQRPETLRRAESRRMPATERRAACQLSFATMPRIGL